MINSDIEEHERDVQSLESKANQDLQQSYAKQQAAHIATLFNSMQQLAQVLYLLYEQ